MASEKQRESYVDEWLEEDRLMLLECWARDGYTYQDIANRIGISPSMLSRWRKSYPDIQKALNSGREIVDYKVENALLKSALGYKTKEVKVTTIVRNGRTIETQTENLEKEFPPNVTACQVWLYNRLPSKWKKNRDNIIEDDDEETTIQVTVRRPNKEQDDEWSDVNESIEISRKKDTDESLNAQDKLESDLDKNSKVQTKNSEIDLDYWPDDWEDEDEE